MDNKKTKRKEKRHPQVVNVHTFMKPTITYLQKIQPSSEIRSSMSPDYVMRNFKKHLTKYEQKEILDYQQVWHIGKQATKIDPRTHQFNSGYDTKKGIYRVVINDHLAYRYQILEVLGQCFSGQVLKCMDHKPKRLVVIKVIRNKDGVHEVAMPETDILKAVQQFNRNNSANNVHMKEKFYFRSHLCITFDLFLEDHYESSYTNKNQLTEEMMKKYTMDILKCLELHREKIVLHDQKPKCIFIIGNGTVLNSKSNAKDNVYHTELTVLPSQAEGAQKTHRDLRQKQSALLSDQQKCDKTSSVKKSGVMSSEYVLGNLIQYLTKYEKKEIQDYKQVWYVGEEVKKVDDASQTEQFNYGYDTKEGIYIAVINDHLAYRYQILEVLGQGFSGQVLKCMDHKTDKLVAIKVIRNQKSVYNAVLPEVRILEALQRFDKDNSANIVHMKEKFIFRGHLCITFDNFLMDLYTLQQTNKGRVTKKELKKYTIEILKCLELLKEKNIVHGDLKPENVLIYKKDGETHVAVADFGGSYYVTREDRPRVFTKAFMSPELLLGKKCESPMDMWSLGCIIAELHCGVRLFNGCDHPCVFAMIMEVLGLPPMGLLVGAPKRKNYFDSNGIPYIRKCRIALATKLATRNNNFINFIERCLEYDPKWRMTPKQALQHPWIHESSECATSSGGGGVGGQAGS
ncbi:dual specificity tyrosine-phosphorylation-regulated kinase 4-like [Paralichthys olivaceus]|uniref:dual specificity tyrosine-phosphorylation-regulated kinase 4-like n=1 Tax=Paralichthys olivaceus TaxID=8255 RepID=UPI00375386C7